MNISEKFTFRTVRDRLNSRRSFLTRLGMASAGMGVFLAAGDSAEAQVTDANLLQFALNLEYLSAEFYTMATAGKTIDQMDIGITGAGTGGATTGGQQVTFIAGSTLARSAAEIAANERAHVSLLRAALNNSDSKYIAKPAINLNALGTGFGSQEEFVALARAIEDVTVSAYNSLVPALQNKAYIPIAVRLITDEAEHAANMRLHTALYNVASSPIDGVDAAPPPTGTQFLSADSNGLTAIRTPSQVLYIAFGRQANQTSGGFFPSGVNGSITTSGSPATP